MRRADNSGPARSSQQEGAVLRPAWRGRLSAALRRLLGLLIPKPSLAWITPSLAQGPAPRRSQVPALARAGINSVLDLRSEAADDATLLARHGLRYRRVPMEDRAAPDMPALREAVDWVMAELAADRKVLVHCRAGAGRSPLVACAVLLRMGYDLQRAYETVRRQRPEMNLADDQAAALQEYGRSAAGA